MKKYLMLPVLLLSFGAVAEVTEADIKSMRVEVQDMSKEEVTARHIELYAAVKADVNEQTCDAFVVFDKASSKEKKIDLMDMEAQARSLGGITSPGATILCQNKGY